MLLGALRSALSAKAAQKKLTVIEAWTVETHKTKALRQSLDKLDGETRTMLLVENAPSVNLERASRNLEGVTLTPTAKLDTYDLMRHEHLILSREAALRLNRGLSKTKTDSSGAARETAEVAAAEKKTRRPSGVGKAAASRVKAKGVAAKKPAAQAETGEGPKVKKE
jgi:hypothetical protein